MSKHSQERSFGGEIIHRLKGLADALERGEDITKTFTCRWVELKGVPVTYTPEMVKTTRELLHADPATFARFLGVSPQTVRAWERGTSAPSEIARRFMDEIRHDPKYWLKRMRSLFVAR